MTRNGIEVTPDMEQQIVHHESRGQTVILSAINSEKGREGGKDGGREGGREGGGGESNPQLGLDILFFFLYLLFYSLIP